MAVKVVQ